MRYDKEEKVWFVTSKEKRSIKRVKAMLTSVCATHLCTECPFSVADKCLKNQFIIRFERKTKVEETK